MDFFGFIFMDLIVKLKIDKARTIILYKVVIFIAWSISTCTGYYKLDFFTLHIISYIKIFMENIFENKNLEMENHRKQTLWMGRDNRNFILSNSQNLDDFIIKVIFYVAIWTLFGCKKNLFSKSTKWRCGMNGMRDAGIA